MQRFQCKNQSSSFPAPAVYSVALTQSAAVWVVFFSVLFTVGIHLSWKCHQFKLCSSLSIDLMNTLLAIRSSFYCIHWLSLSRCTILLFAIYTWANLKWGEQNAPFRVRHAHTRCIVRAMQQRRKKEDDDDGKKQTKWNDINKKQEDHKTR